MKLSCQDPPVRGLTIQQVYAKVNPSVVAVVAEQSDGSAAVGTGVIMTESGYIITNAHVISGGKSRWVALDTGVTTTPVWWAMMRTRIWRCCGPLRTIPACGEVRQLRPADGG